VPAGDRAALCRAIRDYVIDPAHRVDHGRASRERAMSRFTLARMIDEYRSLYDSTLQAEGI